MSRTNTTETSETYLQDSNASEANSMLQNIKISAEKAENPENENTNTIRSVAHEVSGDDKRQRSLTRKAFQNLVLEKRSELERKTKSLMRKYDELSESLTDNYQPYVFRLKTISSASTSLKHSTNKTDGVSLKTKPV